MPSACSSIETGIPALTNCGGVERQGQSTGELIVGNRQDGAGCRCADRSG